MNFDIQVPTVNSGTVWSPLSSEKPRSLVNSGHCQKEGAAWTLGRTWVDRKLCSKMRLALTRLSVAKESMPYRVSVKVSIGEIVEIEMAQGLRALAGLSEDLSVVPSTHMAGNTLP